MDSQFDQDCMRRAVELAMFGQGSVEPNPMVGCVLAKSGTVIGEGYHERYGEAHAEVQALRSLASVEDARGATAYVTLEPCCHHGKTPPCSEALIQAGVARVVIAMEDPFDQVDGGGIGQLRAAGIDVSIGLCREESEKLNAPYLKRLRTGLPWTIAKWAMTLDGRIATTTGESQWITSPESRREVHNLRGRVDAVMTGMGTVVADDPMLNARLQDETGRPIEPPRLATRLVMCRRRVPTSESKLIQSAGQIPVIIAAGPDVEDSSLSPLERANVSVERFQTRDPHAFCKSVLQFLAAQKATNVMLECGGGLLGSFLGGGTAEDARGDSSPERTAECLIDEVHLFLGPKIFGGDEAPGPVGGPGITRLPAAPRFQLINSRPLGNDLYAVYRRA